MTRLSLLSRVNRLEEKNGEAFVIVEAKAGTPSEKIGAFVRGNVPGYDAQHGTTVVIQRFGEIENGEIRLVQTVGMGWERVGAGI